MVFDCVASGANEFVWETDRGAAWTNVESLGNPLGKRKVGSQAPRRMYSIG